MKPGHNDTESLGDGDEDDAAALPASLLGIKLPLTISPTLTGTAAQMRSHKMLMSAGARMHLVQQRLPT
jgi:hypothetical protein